MRVTIRLLPIFRWMLLFLLLSSPAFLAERYEEDFSGGMNGEGIPVGWKLKQWFGHDHQMEILTEGKKKVLHLISQANSFGIYKKISVDFKTTPFLIWDWKVTRLPEGGDVRQKGKDDQAAQVYVIFPRFPRMINSRLVGYIWDTSAPKGEKLTSAKSSNTRYIVLESGTEQLGKWITEKRNVYEDYQTLFGEDPPEGGELSIMIDSDDTESSAESYFTNIHIESSG